jgi:hypothetical protein
MHENLKVSEAMHRSESKSLMDEIELANMLHVSIALVRKWRLQDKGPRYVKLGSLVRYPRKDAEAWLDTLPGGGTSGGRLC